MTDIKIEKRIFRYVGDCYAEGVSKLEKMVEKWKTEEIDLGTIHIISINDKHAMGVKADKYVKFEIVRTIEYRRLL